MLLAVFAAWAAVSLLAASPAMAVINDTGDDGDDVPRACAVPALTFKLNVNMVPVGLPIAGSGLQINAAGAKLVGKRVSSSGGISCPVLYFAVPKFEWKIVGMPPGQSTSISNAKTPLPSVNLGGPGTYRIRLVACPNKCTVTAEGRSKSVGPLSQDLTVEAVNEMAVPPETEPLLPPLTAPANPPHKFTYDERSESCPFDSGVTAPQWVVTEPFRGVASYRLLEGDVDVSKVPRRDSFLNHDTQDHNWDVSPDPPYWGLPQPSITGSMEMEAEQGALGTQATAAANPAFGGDPLRAYLAPTAGDRASTLGFWIFDCGHDPYKTELHPAIGLGVERARAVEIPSTFRPDSPAPGVEMPESLRPTGFPGGLGSNVQVPGIVTDLWFNRRAGEITNDCSTSGLHQPPVGLVSGACIGEPHQLGKTTFRVYLPRDPRLRALEAGLGPPPVPLFVGIEPTPGLPLGGPTPTIEVKQEGGATWLEVTVDLTGLQGDIYARRISAAWAYPQPQNWGAKRWKVRLNKLLIADDAEILGDDGDWQFFFNTNNRDREWTRVFACEGCVDDPETKTLAETTGAGQRLGPDPVLFPGQKVLVHTGGFDDEAYGDDIGTVFDRNPQVSGEYFSASQGGEGSYRLEYRVFPGLPVTAATLTPQARALLEAYTARAQSQCVLSPAQSSVAGTSQVPPRAQCGPVAPARKEADLTQTWHPDNLVLGRRAKRSNDLELFESEPEELTFQGSSDKRLKRVFDRLRARDPKRLNALLADIREELARLPRRLRNDYGELVATLDKTLPANLVRRAVSPGFRRGLRSLKILSRR